MRNYLPEKADHPYIYNDLVLRFSTEEFAKYLRDKAGVLEAELKKSDAAHGAKVEAQIRRYFPKPDLLTPEMMAQAVASVVEGAPLRIATLQTAERLRFCAEHLPTDSTFEFSAQSLYSMVERHFNNGGPMHGFGRMDLYAAKTSPGLDSLEGMGDTLKVGGVPADKLRELKEWTSGPDILAQLKAAMAERIADSERLATDEG